MKNINKKILKKNIKKNKKIIIIIFWTELCIPCKIVKNIIEKMKLKYKNEIKIIKININYNNYVIEKFSIYSAPSLMIIKNKIIIKKIIGIFNKEDIEKIIKKII